jgi:hypothetical protein
VFGQGPRRGARSSAQRYSGSFIGDHVDLPACQNHSGKPFRRHSTPGKGWRGGQIRHSISEPSHYRWITNVRSSEAHLSRSRHLGNVPSHPVAVPKGAPA